MSYPSTMRAATRHAYGTTENVVVGPVPCPEPGPGEVLVRVIAAGLDRATVHLLEGKPYAARLALGLRRPRRVILGQQVVGEVVAVGAEVSSLAIGQRVCGTAMGSFAEYAVAAPATLVSPPSSLGDAAAATFGVSGATAYAALVEVAQIRSGQHVLVLGASGAVGSYAVQLASHLGAQVTAVCSGAKLEFVRGLGAQAAFDYRTTHLNDLAKGTGGTDGTRTAYEVIVDIGGNRRLGELRTVLAPEGTLVIVGGEGGGPFLGGIERNLAASVLDRVTRQRLRWLFSTPTTQGLAALAATVLDGGIEPPVDRTVGLDGLAAAIQAMQRGELRGHVIVTP